jgi:EthD domain
MEPKQIYITRRKPPYTTEAWGPRWRQHGRFVRGLPLWAQIRRYEQCRVLSPGAVEATAGMPSLAQAEYDGVGMVWFRSPEAVAAALADPTVESVFDDEKDVFADPIADTSLFTREIVLRDTGATNVKLVGFLRRKPGHSRDEFAAHWEHVHGPLFLGSEEVGAHVTKYVQNHVLEDFTGVMGDRYDGVVEIGLARIEDAPKLFAQNHLDVVRPDLEHFVDLEDMIVVVTDEVLLYEDALGPPVHDAVPA